MRYLGTTHIQFTAVLFLLTFLFLVSLLFLYLLYFFAVLKFFVLWLVRSVLTGSMMCHQWHTCL